MWIKLSNKGKRMKNKKCEEKGKECKINATAIINKKYVCEVCFEKLKRRKPLRKSWLDKFVNGN